MSELEGKRQKEEEVYSSCGNMLTIWACSSSPGVVGVVGVRVVVVVQVVDGQELVNGRPVAAQRVIGDEEQVVHK